MAEEAGWVGAQPGEDPNPAGFSLVSVVSAAMLVWPDFRSVLSRSGLLMRPLLPRGTPAGPSRLLLPAGLRKAAGQRGPGRHPGWASCAEGLPVEAGGGPAPASASSGCKPWDTDGAVEAFLEEGTWCLSLHLPEGKLS